MSENVCYAYYMNHAIIYLDLALIQLSHNKLFLKLLLNYFKLKKTCDVFI